jgi:hypothetical protein
VGAGQELLGVGFAEAPPLRGRIATRAKLATETLLAAARDPLLVRWRYGLGRVYTFTSDASARWASGWLTWPGYGRLWGQIVHTAMRSRARAGLTTRLERRGGAVHVTVETDDDLPGASALKALVIDPAMVEHQVTLAATGPGRYEGEVALAEGRGSILARPIGGEGRAIAGDVAILDEPYPLELLGTNDDVMFLRAIADRSGGRYDAPLAETVRLARDERVVRPLGPPSVGLALLLFLIDLFLKRVRLGRER